MDGGFCISPQGHWQKHSRSCVSLNDSYSAQMTVESIIEYASRIRELRRAGPTNLEQALAPEFQQLLGALLPSIWAQPLIIVPEFATPGVGRPDLALKRAGQPSRAFIELKSPTKPGNPDNYRDVHDRRQFERFKSLRFGPSPTSQACVLIIAMI